MTIIAVALGAVALLALIGLGLTRSAKHGATAAAATAEHAALAAGRRVDHLVAALAGASEGLLVLDTEDRLIAQNPAAELLASLPSVTRGRRLTDLIPWPALQRALQAARETGAPQVADIEDEAAGRSLVLRVRSLPGFGAVVGLDDASQLRRLESLRRDFVANVSHELKTPLAAIQGFVETLQDDPAIPAATRQRFLDRIARQTDRLNTLVHDLLTLSRLDDGRTGVAEACDFAGVVRETLRDLHSLADKQQLRLHAEGCDAAAWVMAEREALRQVAGNLIDNAIKYTPAGGQVRVTLLRQDSSILLEVTDTGIGLAPTDQARVFERFYRVDRARSRDVGGTGLGLAIVKNTVKGLGGEVRVRSELGRGSTFTVELPMISPPIDGATDLD